MGKGVPFEELQTLVCDRFGTWCVLDANGNVSMNQPGLIFSGVRIDKEKGMTITHLPKEEDY